MGGEYLSIFTLFLPSKDEPPCAPQHQDPTLFQDTSRNLCPLFILVWNLFISLSQFLCIAKTPGRQPRQLGVKPPNLQKLLGRKEFISQNGKDCNYYGILRQNLSMLPLMEWKRSRASQHDGYPCPLDNGRNKNLRHTFANTLFRVILCNPGSVFLAIVWLFKSRAIRPRRRQAAPFRERNCKKQRWRVRSQVSNKTCFLEENEN